MWGTYTFVTSKASLRKGVVFREGGLSQKVYTTCEISFFCNLIRYNPLVYPAYYLDTLDPISVL